MATGLRRNSTCFFAAMIVLVAVGCSSKHKGSGAIGSDGKNVDGSWATAARACWPDLGKNGYDTQNISRNLGTPTHFRAAFPVYAAQTDDAIDQLLAKPLQTAPQPDTSKLTHSQTPVLNRGEAVNGTGPKDAAVQSTNGNAPPDGLCSIQTGTPQGFSR